MIENIFWFFALVNLIIWIFLLLNIGKWKGFLAWMQECAEKAKAEELDDNLKMEVGFYSIILAGFALFQLSVMFFGLFTDQWLGFVFLVLFFIFNSKVTSKSKSTTWHVVRSFIINFVHTVVLSFLFLNHYHFKIDLWRLITNW
jgi:hypothetical protein